MKIFAISDLHLAFGIDKPMDIFGTRWMNYMDRIKACWEERVGEEDVVVIPGDISWATYLEEALPDFQFIHQLPGTKIISKGNHDYWWTTISKLEKFLLDNSLSSIRFMHNNSIKLNQIALCGTRGWKSPGDDDFSAEDKKIYLRELQRLEISLKSLTAKDTSEIIVALHYPPFNAKKEPSEFIKMMNDYGVRMCLYGHIHGEATKNAVVGVVNGIEYKLISADYLNFMPIHLEIGV